MPASVYLILLHTHVVNRHGQPVTTSVTNLDLHDIARSTRTFGCRGYFIVTPAPEQHLHLGRILEHWRSDAQREYHPDRFEALSRVRLASSFEEVKTAIRLECGGQEPETVLTDASPLANATSYSAYRAELEEREAGAKKTGVEPRPIALVFGTGWGVSPDFRPAVHRILAPVYGPEGSPSDRGYNHLSVRAAAAIILDRLFGH